MDDEASRKRLRLRASPVEAVAYARSRVRSGFSDSSLSATLIAREMGLSRTHLSRLFAATEGVGLRRYLTKQRVEAALLRLQSDSFVAVKQVAIESGFSSTTALERAFRRNGLASPTEVRLAAILEGRLTSGAARSPVAGRDVR